LGENGDVLVSIYNVKEDIFKNQNTTKISEIESSSITINGNNQNSLATSGTINNLDLQGPLKGKNISDLITLIESGDTYVNVRRMFNFDGGVGSRINQIKIKIFNLFKNYLNKNSKFILYFLSRYNRLNIFEIFFLIKITIISKYISEMLKNTKDLQ